MLRDAGGHRHFDGVIASSRLLLLLDDGTHRAISWKTIIDTFRHCCVRRTVNELTKVPRTKVLFVVVGFLSGSRTRSHVVTVFLSELLTEPRVAGMYRMGARVPRSTFLGRLLLRMSLGSRWF